jgi:capsular polysaccharide transport system permease protein
MQASLDLAARADRPRLQRLRVIFALMVREMGTRFGRSAGGYLWAIAQPLGGILLLSFAFALALRSPPMGTSFLLFYATGVMPMQMFTSVSRAVAGAISSNRGLLNYPVVGTLDAVLAKFALAALTQLIIATVLFVGIIRGAELHVVLDLGLVALGFALAAALGLGIGVLNCVLFGFFPTWKNVWSVLTRPLFILSGVLFLYEQVPANFQAVLWWNPLTHIVAIMRAGFYGFYHPSFVSLPYVLGIALSAFVIGGLLMRRHATWLIEQ